MAERMEFYDWPDAFDECREQDRPLKVVTYMLDEAGNNAGLIFPSGHARDLQRVSHEFSPGACLHFFGDGSTPVKV